MTVVIIALFALFLLYPLISLFLGGFKDTETGVWTTDNYARFFSKKYYKSALLNSFKLTFNVTVATIILSVPLAYFISSYKIKGGGALETLFIISVMSPNLIGVYSWILLLERNSTVTQLSKDLGIHMPSIYGFGGVLSVFAPKLYPFTYMYVSGVLRKINVVLLEAAESLGRGGLKKVLTVIMPLVTPTLIAAALLVFMSCMVDFDTPALVSEEYHVMPTLIYSELMGETGGFANFAVCMTTIMVVITVTVFLLQRWYVNTRPFTMSSARPIRPKEVCGTKGFPMHLSICLLAAISIIPQYMVVYASFRAARMQVFADGLSLESYHRVFPTVIRSIKNIYLYYLAAIVIIVVLGMLIAYLAVRCKSWLTNAIDTIAMSLYIVPGSVLDITLLIALNHPSMILAGSAIIMVIFPVIQGQACTLHFSSTILYQIGPSMEEAAIGLGDSPSMSFVKVTTKMILPGIASGAILSWITLINELSSSVMLYTANTRTVSVVIYNEVIRASYGTAAALATTLTVATVVSLLIFSKVSGNKGVTM